MSIGRPDYNQKIVPVAEVIGDDEELYTDFGIANIAANDTVEIYSYPVPAIYDLYIKRVTVSTSNPVSNFVAIVSEFVIVTYNYFTEKHIIEGSGAAAIICHGGNSLIIQLTNNYDLTSTFYYSITGYKRLIG